MGNFLIIEAEGATSVGQGKQENVDFSRLKSSALSSFVSRRSVVVGADGLGLDKEFYSHTYLPCFL